MSVALLATVFFANAQSEKFAGAMSKNLESMTKAQTPEDFKAVSAAFERIANVERSQWLPYYYAALTLTSMGWRDEKLDKDLNSAKVIELCDIADALTTENNDKAEILCVRNMAFTQQMLVDAQSRWMSYGMQASKALVEAMELNSANPRIYYLQGMSLFNTPEQFGGGKVKAKEKFEVALEYFAKEKALPMYPNWGKEQTEAQIKICENN